MERWDAVFKTVAAVGGAAVSYLFGGWSVSLGVLASFVAIDYLTGFIAAAIEGKLSSSVGMVGIARKVAIFAMVAVAHLIDITLGETHIFRDATIFFYLANELLSIIENSGRLGVPVPGPLQQAVAILKGRSDVNAPQK